MDDFGKFCYLDVQKTGSTFIAQMLRDSSSLPLLRSQKHAEVSNVSVKGIWSLLRARSFQSALLRGGFYRGDVIYFNSVRHPFNYYASLYNYGCDEKGGLYARLKRNSMNDFYDRTEAGFLGWLEFIMQPKNCVYLGHGYHPSCANAVGFLTYRFLRLSVSDPHRKLSQIKKTDEAYSLYERGNICAFTVRLENIKDDVIFLIDEYLSAYVSKGKAIEFLERNRINSSKTHAASAEMLEASDLGGLVRKRDALIFDNFYRE